MPWRRYTIRAILNFLLIGVYGCTTEVSSDPKLRGGYSKGQSLRLRVDAFTYKFNEVRHPAEAGTHITVPKVSNHLDDATARAEWEERNESTIIAHLPAGTILHVKRIDYVPTLDTATIVPCAVIVEGSRRGQEISLSGISIQLPSTGYPYPVAPDPSVVEIVPAE